MARAIDYSLLENKYYLSPTEQENAVLTVRASDLLLKENMDLFIHDYMKLMKALEPAAAAAGFCSWFRAVCLAQQYAVSLCDTAIDLSLTNLTIQVYLRDQFLWVSFKYDVLRTHGPSAGEREVWREAVFTSFYRDQVRPLLEAFASSADLNVGQLWGQFPSGFDGAVEMFMIEAESEMQRTQIADDFYFLTHQLDASIFGRKKNPFDVKIRFIDNPRDPLKPMRMKASCCMFYRTEGGSYCYSCPRMTSQEREERKTKLLAEVNA